jgi:hypothetical protein
MFKLRKILNIHLSKKEERSWSILGKNGVTLWRVLERLEIGQSNRGFDKMIF